MKTVTLNRYAARENNGSVVKEGFVGGELYRYDADGYVLCREDIDEQGNVVNNLDRKALYDSAGRLVEEQFFRDGNIYRNIAYRGNVGIIENSMSSDGIRVQTVKRMDLYPGFLLMYASNEKGQTLEFVEVDYSLQNIHFFSKYEAAKGYIIEYVYQENGKLLRVSYIYDNGHKKVVAMYDWDGNETGHSVLYNKVETEHVLREKRYLLESVKLRQLNGGMKKWTSALFEYFNGRTSRLEILEKKVNA